MPYPKNPYGYQWELIGPGPSVSIDVWPLQSPFVNCEVSWNRRPARAGTGAAFRIVVSENSWEWEGREVMG